MGMVRRWSRSGASRGARVEAFVAGAFFIGAVILMGFAAQSAQAAPFAKGNLATGKALHDKSCASCHNSMMPDGKGAEIYSEDFRKMQNLAQVRTMIEVCASRSRAGWFEEEIEHVGRYLNDTYYKYTK
jgi:mono/diheme cytochrome c family protein